MFKARHCATGSQVAIKAIAKEPKSESQEFTRAAHEVEILLRVDHPNVVRLFDVCQGRNRIYEILEFVNGPSLAARIQAAGRIAEPVACRIFFALAHALVYLHEECKIAHRDINPETIILTDSDSPKLVHFGFAKAQTYPDQLFTTNCVSPDFGAPELFRGTPYSTEVDVWAMGCTLWVMTVGRLPFAGDGSLRSLIEAVTHKELPKITSLSPELNDLLHRMLAKDMKRRITAKEILNHPWLDAMHFDPVNPFSSHVQGPQDIDEETSNIVASVFQIPDEECLETILFEPRSKVAIAYRILLAKKYREPEVKEVSMTTSVSKGSVASFCAGPGNSKLAVAAANRSSFRVFGKNIASSQMLRFKFPRQRADLSAFIPTSVSLQLFPPKLD
jgi:serine/threonine-protein kinase ULK/ATG1